MQQQHSSAAIKTRALADGVIVCWSHVEFIVVVVISKRAATGDDDGEWDSNSANVDLAVIRQSVAVPSQGERKKAFASIMRAPPRVQ